MATMAPQFRAMKSKMPSALGVFGSIDFNRGDPQNGWIRTNSPSICRENTLGALLHLKGAALRIGGFKLDAKVRRQSSLLDRLFYGHIGGIGLLARALTNAVVDD